MDALWKSGKACSGLEIQAELAKATTGAELALTTVLTVLQRLTDKGLVQKIAAGGRAVKFQAALTREQQTAQALLDILQADKDSELTLTHFVGALTYEQREALNRALRAEY